MGPSETINSIGHAGFSALAGAMYIDAVTVIAWLVKALHLFSALQPLYLKSRHSWIFFIVFSN